MYSVKFDVQSSYQNYFSASQVSDCKVESIN